MSMTLLWIAVSAVAQPAITPPPDTGQDLVVTGARPDRHPLGPADTPYSETRRVPLGSRIARQVAERPFRTISSDSGVAGLVHGSGMDGTGGSFATGVRRRVTDCVADDRQVRPEIACILFRAQRDTQLGELDAALGTLAPLLVRRGLNPAESYHAGHQAFRLAEARDDAGLRAQALRLLIASGRLPEPDRARAERQLSALTAAGN